MATPVSMPRQGQSVESCIITEWHKNKGEPVKKGELLFSYETDKASFEYEAEKEGIVLDIFYEEGDEVPVLTNVAVLGVEGESLDEFKPDQGAPAQEDSALAREAPSPEGPGNDVSSPPSAPAPGKLEDSGETKISPRAKKLAEKLGVVYQELKGSGPKGRIIERDIEQAAGEGRLATPLAREKASGPGIQTGTEATGLGGRAKDTDIGPLNQVYGEDFELVKHSNIRKLIAKGMAASLQNSAQLTHHMSADARQILSLRKEFKKKHGEGLPGNITLNDMVCMAVVRALKKQPSANAHYFEDHMKVFQKVHLGFAVDTERGLMVPVARNADDLTLEGLSSQMKSLAEQCRKGSIDPSLIASEAATFTVSNLGAYGVEMFTPVINLPQVGILGVNTIINRPASLENGVFGFVPYIGLSLTYDHRALDGGPASLFLKTIKEEIENFQVS